jgi:hypothetical protein
VVVTVGAEPMSPDPDARLRARILRLVSGGEHCPTMWDGRDRGWIVHPGAAPFWWLRQKLGGQYRTADFRQAVEGLLEGGLAIEVWLKPVDARAGGHQLLLPGHSEALSHPVCKARGRGDVLDAEPWVVGLIDEDGPTADLMRVSAPM